MAEAPSPSFWTPTPVIGYRAWLVGRAGLWGGVTCWTSRFMHAECLSASAGDGSAAAVPHADGRCSPPCGIYAYKEVGTALWSRMVRESRYLPVIGTVALSGRVVEHEAGFRAQRALCVAVATMRLRGRGLIFSSDPECVGDLFCNPRKALERASFDCAGPMPSIVRYLEGVGEQYLKRWVARAS